MSDQRQHGTPDSGGRFDIDPPLPAGVRRLLVVGGSFDPPHRGHVGLAMEAAREADCDHVLFVPAFRSPHKAGASASAEDRWAMLRLAIEGLPGASATPWEIERPGPSYTVDTLAALRRALGPGVELRLLIGSDQAVNFHRWREPDRIVELAEPVVVLREPFSDAQDLAAAGLDHRWPSRVVRTPLVPISSTEIRRRIAAGEDVSDDIDPAVWAYIQRHGLYRQ